MTITEQKASVAALIDAAAAETDRTPYLEIAQGALRTAAQHLENHTVELDRLAKIKADGVASRIAELETLRDQIAKTEAKISAES